MADKTITDPAYINSGTGARQPTNLDLSAALTYHAANGMSSEIRTKIWSTLVTKDAREKNVFSKFMGGEGSGKPVVVKSDLNAGGSDRVVFTTVAPVRGSGVRGEAVLKNNTGKLKFGTFPVEVDLLRHAVSWTQVLKLMRFTGKTLDQLSADVMSEWAARMEQDLIQTVLRDTCLAQGNVIKDYGAAGALAYSEGLSTDIIQEAKQALIANGGQPMNTGGDVNQEIPGYLFFAPDACLRPLRSDPDYLEAITQADSRSDNNKLYSGSYAKWDNNIIANHNIIIDTASGRQGSPLDPVHIHPGATLAPASGVKLGAVGSDDMINFKGGDFNVPGGGGRSHKLPTDLGHVIMVDKDNKYMVSAVGTNDGAQITLGADVNVGSHTNGKAPGSTLNGPVTVYQANADGTPIGYALAMGEGALYFARGSVTNEQIFHYDDFANSGNEAHLSAVGVQSVYGLAAYEDTSERIPGVQLVECVRQVPGLSIG